MAGCCEPAKEQAFYLMEVWSRRLLVVYRRVGTKDVSHVLWVRQSKETV